MGTNFYWKLTPALPTLPTSLKTPFGEDVPVTVSVNTDDPKVHIGKRSGAGPYCWDCRLTLCKGGVAKIHTGRSDFFDACPKCGQKRNTNALPHSTMVELGFKSPDVVVPKGVEGAASFSWAQDPVRVRAFCQAHPEESIIEDEYGVSLTGTGFLQMLEANCPIEFTESVGIAFS